MLALGRMPSDDEGLAREVPETDEGGPHRALEGCDGRGPGQVVRARRPQRRPGGDEKGGFAGDQCHPAQRPDGRRSPPRRAGPGVDRPTPRPRSRPSPTRICTAGQMKLFSRIDVCRGWSRPRPTSHRGPPRRRRRRSRPPPIAAPTVRRASARGRRCRCRSARPARTPSTPGPGATAPARCTKRNDDTAGEKKANPWR